MNKLFIRRYGTLLISFHAQPHCEQMQCAKGKCKKIIIHSDEYENAARYTWVYNILLIWNANTFQFFIVHKVKGLGPFSLLVQVNLIASILQNEFIKNIPSPSSNCGGKYCHVFNTLKAYIYIHLIYLLQSLSLHDIIHLHDIHTFGINLVHGIPLDHWACQWYLGISMVLITSQLLSPNFSSSKYTISHMKHDQSTPSLLYQSSQLAQPL